MTTLSAMAARSRMEEVPRRISSNDRQLRALFQIGEMIEYDRATATCTVEVPALEPVEDTTVGELVPAIMMRDVIYTSQHFSEIAIVETLPSARTDDNAGETVLVFMPGGMSGPKYAIADIIPAGTTVRNLRNVVNAVASVDYATAISLSTTAVIASSGADGIVNVVYSPENVSGDSQVSTAEGKVSLILQNADGIELRRLTIDGSGVVTVEASIKITDSGVAVTGGLSVTGDLSVAEDLSVTRDLTIGRNVILTQLATGSTTRDLRVTDQGLVTT